MANVNPIPTGRTARVDSNGILDTLVKQVYDNQPLEDASGLHLEEAFKGPYSKIKGVLSQIRTGQSISTIHTTLSSYVGIQEAYDYPACPVRNSINGIWICSKIRCEEIQAGDHGMLYLSYDANYALNDVQNLTEDPTQDVWSISWQSYSVSPYNFLANKSHSQYPCSPTFDLAPADVPPDYWSQKGYRKYINDYMNSPFASSKNFNNENYAYYAPDAGAPDYRLFLNGAEKAVLDKVLLGRNATYHYPVITHQTVKRGAVGLRYDVTLGGNLDEVTTLPNECPYQLSGYTVIKIGDDISQTKTTDMTTYTRREVYAGFTEVDLNFYGTRTANWQHTQAQIENGRWKLESL